MADRSLSAVPAGTRAHSRPRGGGEAPFAERAVAPAATLWADQIQIQRRFVARFRTIGTPPATPIAQKLMASLAHGVTLANRVQRGFAERNTAFAVDGAARLINLTLALNKGVAADGFRICGR